MELSQKQKMALELGLGLATIPLSDGLSATTVLPSSVKYLKPFLGNKLSEELIKNTIRGGIGGSTEGAVRGLLENENPLITSFRDGALGTLTGAVLGLGGANITKGLRGLQLKPFENFDNLDYQTRNKLRKLGKKYYTDYISNREIKNGNKTIKFTGAGYDELSRWNPKQIANLPSLIKDVKNANFLKLRKNTDSRKPFVENIFELKGNNGNHLLLNYGEKTKPIYYFTNDKVLDGTQQSTRLRSIKDSNNIINDLKTNFNPSSLFEKIMTNFHK